jgi:hypothetical protein
VDKWIYGQVANWTKLDIGGYVDKVIMWIKWICGQSGEVDPSKGSYLESINKRQGSLVRNIS